ncbi:MAG: chorismate synthase [Clostridia bacterium]|nr:chorismate synthase [Clostridia bacterium]
MSSVYGENLRLSIFGQSHSPAVGMTLDGLPAGNKIDMDELKRFLARRAPGQNAWSTARREKDEPEFISGLVNDTLCGAPLTAVIRNTDAKNGDYEAISDIPRPGHADYTAQIRYSGFQDKSGGGHFSGRLTLPLCVAGGVCLQLLKVEGITVMARAKSIGDVLDAGSFDRSVAEKTFPAADDASVERMRAAIFQAAREGDSLGGVVECVALGVPAGLGDPMFDGMENRIARAIFAIPAVKGVEFGEGFASARLRGSQNNDGYEIRDGRVGLKSNHAGGILGGITDGMPVVVRAAFKPTPSIAKEQMSVDMNTMQPVLLSVPGRHDPCVVPRAVPCVEAAVAIALYDALLARRREKP